MFLLLPGLLVHVHRTALIVHCMCLSLSLHSYSGACWSRVLWAPLLAGPPPVQLLPAAVVKLMSRWGYSYVENLTWVLLHPNHSILRLPYPCIQRSHITLYIFRKDGQHTVWV